MVHFETSRTKVERPETPPICPKCGSHRTQVIGRTDEPPTVTVRCNACGAISTIPTAAMSTA